MKNVNNRKFLVYMHIAPNNKRYVGITSQSTSHRWGDGGKRYRRNLHFWNAICKYGWDNFEHKIIVSDIDYITACEMERNLIAQYNLTDPNFGYNHTYGGEFNLPSDEVREKLRNLQTNRWKNPEFRNKVVSGLKGHIVTDETKQKISKSKLGKKFTKPSPLRGRKLSEEHKARLRGKPSWCKGMTKETNASLARISEKIHGRKKTEIEILHLSEGHKRKFENGYSPMWINNGVVETCIDTSCQDIPDGFVKGRIVNYKYMYKGNESKRVSLNLIDSFLKDGWKLGRGNLENLRRSTQKCKWIYNDIEFRSAKELASYLNSHGYPNIVSGTITSLYNKGFDKSIVYNSLHNKIIRIDL